MTIREVIEGQIMQGLETIVTVLAFTPCETGNHLEGNLNQRSDII